MLQTQVGMFQKKLKLYADNYSCQKTFIKKLVEKPVALPESAAPALYAEHAFAATPSAYAYGPTHIPHVEHYHH